MAEMQCKSCGGMVQQEEGKAARFCPYCGKELAADRPKGPSELDKRLAEEKKPQKKYDMIMEVLRVTPDDFEANRALLYHGNLHRPMKGHLDFSIIKAHLLSVFHTPDDYTAKQIDEKLDELLRGEQLMKTIALAPDGFFDEYIRKLAYDYVDLFIKGDSRYSRGAFGFPRSAESTAKLCAEPVKKMIAEVAQSNRLEESERLTLAIALREAYAKVFTGYSDLLNT